MDASGDAPVARRAGPHDRRRAERRDLNTRRLLPAVERLLEEFTYAELSVDQIVAEAGISRSTFYNHFEDKGDLLRALTVGAMGALIDATQRWWSLPPDAPREQVRAALAYLYEHYRPHAVLMGAVSESLSHDPGVRAAFEESMREGTTGIADYIRSGQAVGVFRGDLDAAQAADFLVWMFERGLSRLSQGRDAEQRERVVAAATDILWKSLR